MFMRAHSLLQIDGASEVDEDSWKEFVIILILKNHTMYYHYRFCNLL